MNNLFSSKIIFVLILLMHLLILSKIIFFPYPELFVYPYLTNHGLLPYSQILDQHFPGLMFLPINLDNLGMNTPDIARAWLMAVVVITHFLIFLVSRRVLKSDKQVLMVNLLYLIWQPFFEGGVLWIDTFLVPILLGAFYFCLKFLELKKLNNLFLMGMILGVGIVFKQVVIPLAGLLVFYLFWQTRSFKALVYYSSGVLIPTGLLLIYLSSIGVFNDFIFWTVTFNLTAFAEYGRKYPEFSIFARVVFVLAGSAGLIFWKDRKKALLLFVFIVGALSAIYARFDLVHFQPALPFVMLATVIGITRLNNKHLKKVIALGYFSVTAWWLMIFYQGNLSSRVLFFEPQVMEIASKIEKQTSPGERIFIFGAPFHLYQITQTLPAGNIFVFQFPWFMMEAGDRVLEGLRKDQPKLVVTDRSMEIEGSKIINYSKAIDLYIMENYQVIDQVGETLIMRRK